MTLPELNGWAPTAIVARRLGVTPATVRRRASKGLLQSIPNPLGPGALYREIDPGRPALPAMGGQAGQTAREPHHGAVRMMVRDDRYVLGLLPASGVQVARSAGLARGTAYRRLRRLERWGLARRAEVVPPGPQGGRPEVVWRVTSG